MELIIILTVVFFVLLGVVVYMFKEAFADRVLFQKIELPHMPQSFGEVKIFFISDIHRRKISNKIIDQVQSKGKIDLVIVGGDLLEKGVPLENVENNIQQLKRLGPVFFVWGNNDYEVDILRLDALLLNLGVNTLANSSVLFESETGDRLYIVGVDDLAKGRDNLELALSDTNKDDFKILISHNPEIRRKILAEQGISLMLAGHTHGGQIRIFGFGPSEKGKLEVGKDFTYLISNGYGTTAIPLRLGAKAETHLITLSHKMD
jgi:predicted MPP superfamily phosphohydrolase